MRVTTYKHSPVPDFPALVGRYSSDELASPFRSTVPLLAYWEVTEQRGQELGIATGAELGLPLTLGFEYTVPVLEGRGQPSHTDLMLVSKGHAVAIEAKYTEPMYENVAAWLRSPRQPNREAVLRGWLSAINTRTGSTMAPDDVLHCTYQMVHRTASACVAGRRKRAVVYVLFDADEASIRAYAGRLGELARCISRPEQIDFWVYSVPLIRSPTYVALQDRWQSGERDLSPEVRTGLLDGTLLAFGTPVVQHVQYQPADSGVGPGE